MLCCFLSVFVVGSFPPVATKVADVTSSQFASVRSTVCSLGRDRYGDFTSYREQFHFSDCKLLFKLTFSSMFVLLPLEVVGVHEIAFKAASFSIYTFFLPLCCLREREKWVRSSPSTAVPPWACRPA